ncbi:hypothetical protein ACFFRR_000038 [Megaselia abdita]
MPPKLSKSSSTASYQPVDIEEFDENGHIKQFTEDFDDDDNDIIGRVIGDIGKWQWKWVLILSLFQVISTFNIICFSFQAYEKDYWCARPSDGIFSGMNVSVWKNITLQTTDSCQIVSFPFDLNQTIQGDIGSYQMTNCENFEFSQDYMGPTIVEEFNLVCDNKKFVAVVEMSYLMGAAVASVVSGWISDKFGRRTILMCSATLQVIIGTLIAFSNSLIMYMVLRTMMGYVSMTVAVLNCILAVELVSGKYRTLIGILNMVPVALSYIIISSIAYFIRDWRQLQIVISLPWSLLLLIWFCVPESPRWLLVMNKYDELEVLIRRIAKMNNRTLPTNLRKILEASPKETDGATTSNQVNPLKIAFNSHYLKTTCLTLITWFTLIGLYFSLTLNLSNLGGDIYVNTAVSGVMETVSILVSIFVVFKLGTRETLIVYMLVAGIVCLATNFVAEKNIVFLGIIAKCFMGAANAIITIFTAQQYATHVRNFAVGLGNLAAGAAFMSVPYMWFLEDVWKNLPLTVLGVYGLIGAVALFFNKKK